MPADFPLPERREPQPIRCQLCKDVGWVLLDVPTSHPQFGKPVRCKCQEDADAARRLAKLAEVDGLTARERRRNLDNVAIHPHNADAVAALAGVLERGAGIVVLVGPVGRGKTTLMHALANSAKEQGRVAIYSKMGDLLDWIRQAFRDDSTDDPSARWRDLITAPVLLIDEIDKFHATEWAKEKFFDLLDWRWRYLEEKITVIACNSPLDALPAPIRSRLLDGRAAVFTIAGEDARPFTTWGAL